MLISNQEYVNVTTWCFDRNLENLPKNGYMNNPWEFTLFPLQEPIKLDPRLTVLKMFIIPNEIIPNGWKAAGITDAIKNNSSSLDPLDPFSTIDPLEQPAGDEIFVRQRTYPMESSTNFESGVEDEWVFEDSLTKDRNIFDIFDMNKNVHWTSLFHVRQNCETALFI